MSRTVAGNSGRHAIVIGGGMAGLLAARVLANHVDRVTVIDRDHFPSDPVPRRGVPQGRHVHVLLTRGYHLLQRLFPGLDAELAAAGAPAVDWMADAPTLAFAGWVPRQRSHLRTRMCSRPLLEWLVYRHVNAMPNVRFLEDRPVTGLVANAAGTRIARVRTSRRGQASADEVEELSADLVIDASGRTSRAPQWLEELGYPRPRQVVIDAQVGYATRYYRRPTHAGATWQGLLLSYRAPCDTRAGVLWPLEREQWIVTLAGAAGDYPPTDDKGFLAFARTLRSPILYEAIQDATPVSPIYGYRHTQNQRRYYERLSRWPEGFIVMGDAVCALNPVYGQGMTVAALSAVALDRSLRRSGKQGLAAPGLARRFQRRLRWVLLMPWLMATAEDYRWPTTKGGQPTLITRLLYGYVDQILFLSTRNVDVARTFGDVWHLVRPPIVLARPTILFHVARRAIPWPRPAEGHETPPPALPGL